MADFKEMYFGLFHTMTNLIAQMQAAQQAVEEMYMEHALSVCVSDQGCAPCAPDDER